MQFAWIKQTSTSGMYKFREWERYIRSQVKWYGLPDHIFDAETGFEELRRALVATYDVESSEQANSYFSKLACVDRDVLSNGTTLGEATRTQGRTTNVYKASQRSLRASIPESEKVTETTRAAIADISAQMQNGVVPVSEKSLPTADFMLKLMDQLASLAKHPYFSRSWIIQEFVLSQKAPIALIGSCSFHQQGIGVLISYLLKLHDIFSEQIWVRFLGILCAIVQASQLNIAFTWYRALYTEPLSVVRSSPAARFLHFHLLFPERQYTVAHDVFYSLLGLLDMENLPTSLEPDYRLSFDHVSWHYASYILQNTRDLRILGSYHYELSDCPTWVPDIRYSNRVMDRYRSKPRTQGPVSVSADGRELCVEGARVGAVLKCSCQYCPSDVGEVNLSYLRDVLLPEASHIKSQTLQDTFAEWIRSYYKITTQHGPVFVGRYSSMDSVVVDFLALRSYVPKDELDLLPLPASEMLALLARTSCPNPEILNAILLLANMRWCLLDTGDIVMCQRKPGDSAQHIRGDSVWALRNSYSMSLLRPKNNVWEYMGLIHQWRAPTDSDSSEWKMRNDSAIDLDDVFFSTRDVQKITLV
jgi:hypothetical protein